MSEKEAHELPIEQPKSIKLSTIWKALVYTFASIGLILSVVYVNDIFNSVVDSRAEIKAQKLLKENVATEAKAELAPIPELKANQ